MQPCRSVRPRLVVLGFAGALALVAPPLAFAAPRSGAPAGAPVSNDSLYAVQTTSLDGKPIELSQYAGKVTLVVNVASECGYTPQYEGLQALHQELAGKGFAVLGFPSNEFGGQEPGSSEAIKSFCERKFGVSFPMFSKLVTKPGPEQSPVYAFLTRTGHVPNWNFCKYVVGKDGQVAAYFPSKVAPEAPELREAISAALAR